MSDAKFTKIPPQIAALRAGFLSHLNQSGYRITQDDNGKLTFASPGGQSKSTGYFENEDTVVAKEWGNKGKITNGGKTILWDNGSHWER